MSMSDLILLILLPGALGGGVQWLSNLVRESKEKDQVATLKDIAPLPMFTQVFVGCGGALGITLVMFAVEKFPKKDELPEEYIDQFLARLLPQLKAAAMEFADKEFKSWEDERIEKERQREVADF